MNLNKLIRSIHVIDSNFKHIAKTGNINGTLHVEIQRIVYEVAEQAFEAGRDYELDSYPSFDIWWKSINQQEDKPC